VHGQFIHGLKHVAGVDVSFFPDGTHAVAAVVVISYPQMEVVYERCATFKLKVPYMAGFLAFREVPALKAMLEEVPSKWQPQAVLVDGNGVFHPRRCGSATHLGIVTGLPTIGVAKDVLKVGDVNVSTAREIAKTLEVAGSWAPLVGEDGKNNPLAVLLRPNVGKKTVVVSVGHKISLNSAIALTASLCKASIPEPIRQADLRSRAAVRAWFSWTPVAKLKMPKEDGAGDLLQVTTSELETRGDNMSDFVDDERNAKHSRCGLHRNGNATTPLGKRAKHSSKTKMVWRIKTTSMDLDENVTITSPEVNPDTFAIPEWSFSRDAADDDDESWGLWKLLKWSLCGLCVVRA
jgi:deoxyinosine 3'endonuclease (endonuclease V)